MTLSRRGTPFWILNAHVVTQNERRDVLLKHHVLVDRDGRITEIRKSLPRRTRGTRAYDAHGKHLFPGFIQTHIHLCQTLFRNLADDLELLDWLKERIWVFEAAHTRETLRTSAELGIHELLSSGTTCILDMGTVRHTEEIYKAVERTGIRANVGKCLMDSADSPAGLREDTGLALREAEALFQKWHGRASGRVMASFAPRFALSCTEKLLREVAELSQRHNALVHTHGSENAREVETVRKLFGAENVEYFERLGLLSSRLVYAHGVWLNANEQKLLARSGSHVTHCPSSNLKLASGIADLVGLRKAGVHVALGADGAPCNNGLSALTEMRLASLLPKPKSGPTALPAHEALDLGTREGARALGLWNEVGSIEVGKKADLVLVDLQEPGNYLPDHVQGSMPAVASALVYASTAQHVRATWVDGQLVYDGREVLTLPRAALLKRAAKAHQLLRSKTKP